jgi:hypothetical protein
MLECEIRLDRGEGAVQYGCAIPARAPVDTCELVAAADGELRAYFSLIISENVDAQPPSRADHWPAPRCVGWAEADVRRIERHRRHRLAGETHRAVAVVTGNHRDAGAEMPQYGPHGHRMRRLEFLGGHDCSVRFGAARLQHGLPASGE